MNRILSFIILLFSFDLCSAQDQEVKATIESFFEGFHKKDTLALQQLCISQLVLQSISESASGSKLTSDSLQKFLQSIASIPVTTKFEEKILSHTIKIDGSMAIDWTPYEFYVNGKKSHSGVNVFTLYKENGLWKIVAIIDTRRK